MSGKPVNDASGIKSAIRVMPVMQPLGSANCPLTLSFSILSEEWAQTNHSQSLTGLAARGGFGPSEALANIQRRKWSRIPEQQAINALNQFLRLQARIFRTKLRVRRTKKSEPMAAEEKHIVDVIKAARTIQEFLWCDMNQDAGLEEFKRMFRKRVAKIDEVDISNPHWKIELKKRLLQTAAIAVNLLGKLDDGSVVGGGIHPTLPSNLPQYAAEIDRKG